MATLSRLTLLFAIIIFEDNDCCLLLLAVVTALDLDTMRQDILYTAESKLITETSRRNTVIVVGKVNATGQ